MNDLVLALSIVGLFAILLFQCTGNKQRFFWPVLITGLIFTSGLSVQEISLFDEMLIAFAILYFSIISKNKIIKFKIDKWQIFHRDTYNLLMVYLIIESARGMIVFGELRKFRWVVFFILLISLSHIASKRSYMMPSPNKLALSIAKANVAHLTFYILFGIFAEYYFGVNRFDLQQPGQSLQYLWGTTAYVLFSIVTAIAPIYMCISYANIKYKLWGWICLALALFASFYYESRAALIAIALSWIFAMPIIGLKKTVSLVVFGVLPATFVCIYFDIIDLEVFSADLFKIWQTLIDPMGMEGQSSEIDRYAHILVAWHAILESPLTFLFGHGYRVSGSVIGPYLLEVLSQLSPETILKMKETDFNNVGTEALTAWIVDTGIIGIGLLLLLHIIVIVRAWKSRNPARLSIIATAVLCIFWLPIIDFRDIVLYYLLLMPNGILSMLIGDNQVSVQEKLQV